MSSRKQQKLEEDNNSSTESENFDEDGVCTGEMETIDVDFEVKFPDDGDFQGIKNLLHQLFLKAHIDTSELAELLIKQNKITGVLKQSIDDEMDMEIDDEDFDVNFGVFSVINLTEKRNKMCVKQIHTYLQSQCKKSAQDGQFEILQRVLNNNQKQVGLVISERMVNIPPKIAVPLYTNAKYDMAQEKGFNNFEYFILICKIVVFSEADKKETVVYTNAEEEIIAEFATMSFDFSVAGEVDSGLAGGWTDEDAEGHRKRRVIVLPSSCWDGMCEKLATELEVQTS